MNEEEARDLALKIILGVMKKKSEESLDVIFQKYAFDVKLPYQVKDTTTGEITWADSINFELRRE